MTSGSADEPSWTVSVEETPWQVVVNDSQSTTVVIEESVPAEVTVTAPGPQGARGTSILSGEGTPGSTVGAVGDFYLDVTVSRLYGPKTSEGWGIPVSLIGLARETVYFSRSGTLSVVTGAGVPWRAATEWTVKTVTLTVVEPPSGTPIIVDVRRLRDNDEVSLFAEGDLPVLSDGEATASFDIFLVDDLVIDDRLFASIIQVGDEAPGIGLTVQVDLQETV